MQIWILALFLGTVGYLPAS